MDENNFSIKLQRLMQVTNMKGAVLSKAVQYDQSYVSKWLSGKMLPSEKNVKEVIGNIVVCLLDQNAAKLEEEYGLEGYELSELLTADLYEAWESSRRKETAQSITAAMPIAEVVRKISGYVKNAASVYSVLDLFLLPHEDRLVLAGIRDGHFDDRIQFLQYSMGISLHSEDCVYDAIFLIHMLTNFSGMDFKLYHCPEACGKCLYSMDERAVTGFLFPGSRDCIAVGDMNGNHRIRSDICSLLGQEALIFQELTMHDTIADRIYIQTMLSSDICWVLGHAVELLMPQDVYEELLVSEGMDFAEYLRLYQISQSVLKDSSTRVLIYESAIADLALKGEIDFYNHPVKLKTDQILSLLDYYTGLCGAGAEIRVVDGGFSDDFRYITNPCLFMSGTACYLRLENNRYEHNIRILRDGEAKKLFQDFFDTVWWERPNVVISDRDVLKKKIERYRRGVEIPTT